MIRSVGAMARCLLNGAPLPRPVAESSEYRWAAETGSGLPMVLQIERVEPALGEPWPRYRERAAGRLRPVVDGLQERVGIGKVRMLYAGNAVAATLTTDQLIAVAEDPGLAVTFAELDPLLPVVSMNEVIGDVGAPAFQRAGGGLTGDGVVVAVLDTGIDRWHPALSVADSVEVGDESIDVPGVHGTHCAGIIASTDPVAPGIAPGVDLINVKVLRADGTGRHTDIIKGVDHALDRSADILSISLGLNHLPPTVPGGHDWSCADGCCPLCTAADTAVAQGAVVVAAAGNDHQRCDALRAAGDGGSFDTELSCPGQARGALTVGAVHKATHVPCAMSSHGPTAYRLSKPDLCAPGVDILSTSPVPRDPGGRPAPGAPRPLRFRVLSGTSMAASVVAGACALLIESARRAGSPADPASVRRMLLESHVEPIDAAPTVVGAGRLRLA